ncbi:ribonuclease H-like domain-containing protein [Tanacetum coccineum]
MMEGHDSSPSIEMNTLLFRGKSRLKNYLASVYSSSEISEERDCTKVQAILHFVSILPCASKKDVLQIGSTRRRSDVTSVFKEATLPENVGQREEMTSRDHSHSRFPEQQLAYEDFDQIEKLDLEEMDLKWQMAMLSVRVHKFEQKAGRKIDFDKKESARFNKKKVRYYKCLQRGHFARECRAKGGENELGWDDSAFSVFTTNSEEVEGRPHFKSDKSSKVNTNDFASSDSSVKSSEPKSNDSTSCASTSSVSTSESEAEIESNVGTPIQEPIIVQDFPRPVHSRNNVNHQNQFVPQAVLLRTGKVNIPPARPQPVPTGKPKVPAPVPTGRQNRPFPVPTDRGYSPS